MRFHEDVRPYVTGASFLTSFRARLIGENSKAASRLDYLEEAARGLKVLHIGFTDHEESIEAKRPHGLWLHDRLMQSAARVLGIDVNEQSVVYCRDQLGIGDIHVHDVIADAPLEAITADHWDIAVLGEILEHVPNPVAFLSDLRAKYGANIGRLIVTVPNAFFAENFASARHDVEWINTDHRYWFTPFTLAKIANDAGWTLGDFHFVDWPSGNGIRDLLTRGWKGVMQKRHPMMRETLIGELHQ